MIRKCNAALPKLKLPFASLHCWVALLKEAGAGSGGRVDEGGGGGVAAASACVQ